MELKFCLKAGTKFVELSERLQNRVIDIFAQQESILNAAHDKAKSQFPERHARFAKAQARIRKHQEFLGLVESKTNEKRELLAKRSRTKRWGALRNAIKSATTWVVEGVEHAVHHVTTAVGNAAISAVNTIGDGLQEVGGVIVMAAAEVGDAMKHVSKHVTKAIVEAGEAATNFAKAGYQWAENVAKDVAEFAVTVANAVAEFATFIWDLLAGWDCSLSGTDLLNAAKNIFSVNPKGFRDMKAMANDAKNFEEGTRVVAQSICMSVWTKLEANNPVFSVIYNIITTFVASCNMLGDINPAISLGVTVDFGVTVITPKLLVGASAGIGHEFGVALDKHGNRMCYIGSCVTGGIAMNMAMPPTILEGSVDVGFMLSFWADAGHIPGSLSIIEFSTDFKLGGMGVALDLAYMFDGGIGTCW